MGTWGTGIFDSDDACDIRDGYRTQIEDGVDDAEALRWTLESCGGTLDHPEFGPPSLIALAATMSRIGRLDPGIRDRAVAAIDSGADLATWEAEDPISVPKRRAALAKARVLLVGPQPKRQRIRPPRRETFGLAAGDALAITVPSGLALLRVVRVDTDRTGETLLLEEMQFRGSKLPSQEKLDQLEPRAKGKVDFMGVPRFKIHSSRETIDWKRWGFTKAASFAARPGDESAGASAGVDWEVAAGKLRGEKGWL